MLIRLCHYCIIYLENVSAYPSVIVILFIPLSLSLSQILHHTTDSPIIIIIIRIVSSIIINNLSIIKLNRINCVQVLVSIENRNNIFSFLSLTVCMYGSVSAHIMLCVRVPTFSHSLWSSSCFFFNIFNLLFIFFDFI